MNTISNYNDLNIHPLQQIRLYIQSRPLIRFNRLKKRNITHSIPEWINHISQELNSDYIAIDCGGWYFSNSDRNCTAIELSPISNRLWHKIHYEYDYLSWHPTYLTESTVLAYHSSYFKYAHINDLLYFFKIWSDAHNKLIIGIDPSKLKFNYLKYSLVEIIRQSFPNLNLRILCQEPFNLLFVLEQ